MRKDSAGNHQQTNNISVKLAADTILSEILQRAISPVARIIQQHIYLTKPLKGGLNRAFDPG